MPTAWAAIGTPASNRFGGAANVVRSIETDSIIEPPEMNGGMAESTSDLPQRHPIPRGPSILWPLQAMKSTPSATTSTGMCGTLWQASRNTRAPTVSASLTIAGTSFTVPSKFDW